MKIQSSHGFVYFTVRLNKKIHIKTNTLRDDVIILKFTYSLCTTEENHFTKNKCNDLIMNNYEGLTLTAYI